MENIVAMELALRIGKDSQAEYDKFLNKNIELRVEIDRIREANRKLRKEIKAVGSDDKRDLDTRVKLTRQLREEVAKNENQLRDLTKEQRALNKEFDSLKGATKNYDALNKEAKELKNNIREIRSSGGIVDPRDLARLKQLDRELNNVNKDLGGFKSNAISAFSSLKTGLLGLGIGVGIRELIQGVFEAGRVFADFEEQIAFLGAISGATGEDLKALENDARRLGETTFFTASQVAALQIEFARFGFNTREILAATEATLDAALATGEATSDVAKVVAQNIRAYGLEAEEAARVTDLLTEAFNSSGLRLETFREAGKLLAPTARTLGVEIEESAAAIGILADNGLEGTIATQALGSSLQRLADEEHNTTEAAAGLGIEVFNQKGQFVGLIQLLRNVQEATKDFSEQQRIAAINQVFGERAARSFILLLNAQKEVITENGAAVLHGAEALEGYTKQLEASAGAGAKAAAIIGDTLSGDVKILQSTFEAFQINAIDRFDGGIRDAIQGVTSLIQTVNSWLRVPVSEQLQDQRTELNLLVAALQRSNTNENVRALIIDEINRKHPEFLEGINLETASYEELQQGLEDVNEAFRRKIILQETQEEINELIREQVEIQKELVRLESGDFSFLDVVSGVGGKVDERRKFLNDKLDDIDEQITRVSAKNELLLEQFGDTASKQTEKVADGVKSINKEVDGSIKTISDRRKELLDLRENLETQLSQTNVKDSAGITKLVEQVRKIDNEIRKLDPLASLRKQTRGSIPIIVGSLGELKKALSEAKKTIEQAPDAEAFIEAIKKVDKAQAKLFEKTRKFNNSLVTELGGSIVPEPIELNTGVLPQASSILLAELERIANKRVSLEESTQKRIQEISKRFLDENTQVLIKENFDRQLELEEEFLSEKMEINQEFYSGLGEAVGLLLSEQEDAFKEFQKGILLTILEATKRIVQLHIAQLFAQEVATKSFAGIATAAFLTGIVEGLFSGAASIVRSFEQGGVVDASSGGMAKGPSHRQGGMQGYVRGSGSRFEFQGNEAILNSSSMASKDVIRAEGTPLEIASALNAHKHFGVKFAPDPKLFEVIGRSNFTPQRMFVPQPPLFQGGGLLNELSGTNTTVINVDLDSLADKLADRIKDINLSVDVETFKRKENTFNQVQSNSFS